MIDHMHLRNAPRRPIQLVGHLPGSPEDCARGLLVDYGAALQLALTWGVDGIVRRKSFQIYYDKGNASGICLLQLYIYLSPCILIGKKIVNNKSMH